MSKKMRDSPVEIQQRRKSDAFYALASSNNRSPEKYPKDVRELVEKKIASEYQFNQHARMSLTPSVGLEGGRRKSTTDVDMKTLKMKYQKHHGDENLSDKEVKTSKLLADKLLPSPEQGYDSETDETAHLHFSPRLLRRHSHSQENPQVGNKIDMHLAKLAQMKLKLEPLPSRQRAKSLASEDIV